MCEGLSSCVLYFISFNASQYAGKSEDGVAKPVGCLKLHTMAEAPNELSSQQGSDPALCSEGHPHELPAALQRIQLPEPSLEEKREVVQKWNNKAADIFILIHEG